MPRRVRRSAEVSEQWAQALGHRCGIGEVGHVGAGDLDQVGAGLAGQPRRRLVQEVVGAGGVAAGVRAGGHDGTSRVPNGLGGGLVGHERRQLHPTEHLAVIQVAVAAGGPPAAMPCWIIAPRPAVIAWGLVVPARMGGSWMIAARTASGWRSATSSATLPPALVPTSTAGRSPRAASSAAASSACSASEV